MASYKQTHMHIAKRKTSCIFIGLFFLFFLFDCNYASDKKEHIVRTDSSQIDSLSLLSSDSIQAKGLISIEEAKRVLEQEENFVLFEVSKKVKYKSGHLPNAISVWRPDYEAKTDFSYTGMRATKGEIEYFLSQKGVHPSDKIILYDTKGSCDALRLAWILQLYGHEDVQVINGGKIAWEKAGYTLSHELPSVVNPTKYQFDNQPKDTNIVSLVEVKKAINAPNVVILDTREPEEYLGQPYISKGKLNAWKQGAFTYGCIPSAVHLNWSEAVNLDGDHRFKCLKDLKYNFTNAGITPDKEILIYCQSGVRSAHTCYVLKEILGYPNVRNYDGSWIEWSYNYVMNKNVEIERCTTEKEHQALYAQLKKELGTKNPLK